VFPFSPGFKRLLADCFPETLLVTKTPLAFLEADSTIVTDLFAGSSALTGIHAALFYAETPYVFITACDAPFIRQELIALMLDEISTGIDIVIPETAKGVEPLFAVYSLRCLEPVTRQLQRGEFRIRNFFRKMRVKPVGEKKLRRVDTHLLSFYNINTPQELAKARQLVNT
jgi:molybdopterin-guanine dinucleotide biosynthesis protein A